MVKRWRGRSLAVSLDGKATLRPTHQSRPRNAVGCEACDNTAGRDSLPRFDPFHFTLPWPPSLNHAWRSARDREGRIFVRTSDELRRWRAEAKLALLQQRVPRRSIDCPVSLDLKFTPPHDHRSHDLDNLLKPILDLMVRMDVLLDDRIVDEIHATRLMPDQEAAAAIAVSPCPRR